MTASTRDLRRMAAKAHRRLMRVTALVPSIAHPAWVPLANDYLRRAMALDERVLGPVGVHDSEGSDDDDCPF